MSSPARADAASLSMLVAAITDEHDDGSKRGGADVHKTIADNNSSLRSATDIRSMKGGGAAVTNSSARADVVGPFSAFFAFFFGAIVCDLPVTLGIGEQKTKCATLCDLMRDASCQTNMRVGAGA